MLEFAVADGPPPAAAPGRRVNVWQDDAGHPFAEATAVEQGYRLEWRGIGTMAFAPGSPRVRLWPAPGVTAAEAVAGALQVAQPVVLQALGYQTLHASGVRLQAGTVAFCGVSGSGKSTIAFALGHRAGATQIADDALVLDVDSNGTVLAVALPFRARLRPLSRAFFSDLPSAPESVQNAVTSPLLAVFVLASSDQAPAINLDLIAPTRAFSTLLTHAHCFDESDRTHVASMAQAYLAIADTVPVYHLAYPKDFRHLGAVADRVLDAAAAQGARASRA